MSHQQALSNFTDSQAMLSKALLPPRSHRETTSQANRGSGQYHSFSFRKNVEHQMRYSLDHNQHHHHAVGERISEEATKRTQDYHRAINEVARQIEGIERDLEGIESRDYPLEEEGAQLALLDAKANELRGL